MGTTLNENKVPYSPEQKEEKIFHFAIKRRKEPEKFKMNLKYLDTAEKVKKYVDDFKPPNYTIKELRSSIPAELFKKSLVKSSYYLMKDIVLYLILYKLSTLIELAPLSIQVILWPIYWVIQGIFMTALWIVAHECGHQAFSDSKSINNFVGLVLHSFLLVPYHSWRITHANHHAHTGNVRKDQVFVPHRKEQVRDHIFDSPLFALIRIFKVLILGWPAYLLVNASGQKYPRWNSHFKPNSDIFKANQWPLIVLSDIGVLATLSGLAIWVHSAGWWSMVKYYLVPYLNVNAWLVMITLLQHTDVYLPLYENCEKWNFVRGALTTVDRDFGWFLNSSLHNINDSHIAHHLFSQMPHYNTIKATPYLKEALGDYYIFDDTWFPISLYKVAKNCNYVDDEGDILFYKH